MRRLTARLVCRLFGHRAHTTVVRRGALRGVVVGCTRCDRILATTVGRPDRMDVPRG